MRLSLSGIAPDKKRKTVTWVNGRIIGDEFMRHLYASLARDLKVRMLFHHPSVIAVEEKGAFSMSGFFYISRFILRDVKIIEGSLATKDFLPEGAIA